MGRVKIKRKRMMEKQLLAEEQKEIENEKQMDNAQPSKPFAAVLRERKMSLSKTSKTSRRRKKSSQKPGDDIQPILENETKSSPNSSPSKKRKSKLKSKASDVKGADCGPSKPKKKRKHQRTGTKHGSLDLMEITRDVGHLDIVQPKNKKDKKTKSVKTKRHRQTID